LTAGARLPVALDAMGGDRAPAEIVAGAREAADEFGVEVVLVGPPELIGDPLGLPVVACTEVIAMDDDPAPSVRRKKDSSIVRCAELVRDGAACATVSAGNTGAVMAAALLRLGRIKGVVRPCIATPVPRPGSTPVLLADAGANAECTAEMLVQFAQLASAHATSRFGVAQPRVGLLSIGEEQTKGTPLVKETHERLADPSSGVAFYGNVEGRDLLDSPVDVVVTDGFTGNVALKTLEGALRFMFATITKVIGTDDETRRAGDVLLAHLLPLAEDLDPDTHGGAILLGVDGVSVISHGSSSARAIKNALHVAHDLAQGGVVDALRAAIQAS
jgi:glycerol-3-phosphate acyltransferase PlsX